MAIDDKNRVFDGYSNLANGVDGGRRPNLIDQTQCAEAENCIMRGGSPSTRPSFLDLNLSFQNPDLAYDPFGFRPFIDVDDDSFNNFHNAVFQGASYYAPTPDKACFMATIGGRLYQITPGIGRDIDIFEVPLPFRNSANLTINYMLQADVYHITQDGEAQPIIYDGTTARRAMIGEIFAGKMMGVGMGRIVLVGPDDNIYFGDIFDGKGNGAADMLGFTETNFLNEGFPSRIPAFMGQPRAVQFIPQQDTATGVGECLVFGEYGVESFFLSIPRTSWKDSAFQRTALLGVGITGHRALTLTNADIGFRALDGWRSYRQARAEINQWAHIPLSTNVRKWTDLDTRSLLNYCSAITFDQRVLFTCTPYPNSGRLYHNGLLALDFDVLASFGASSNPAWDGHWTNAVQDFSIGIRVQQLVEGTFHGEHRAFAFIFDTDGLNEIVEIQRIPEFTDGAVPVKASIITRSMDFQSEFNEKMLHGGDVWVDSVTEPTHVEVSWRPDQVPFFTEWDSFDVNPIEGLSEGEAPILTEGYAPRHKLFTPGEETDDLGTMRSLRNGFEHQVKIDFTGRAAIRKLRVHAEKLEEIP